MSQRNKNSFRNNRLRQQGSEHKRPAPSAEDRKLLMLNKPFDVLCQFSDDGSGRTNLSNFVNVPDVYPAGRLDRDSEGLLLLTNDGQLQARISSPKFKQTKTYWAQVEGIPDEAAITALQNGVELNDGLTRPAEVALIDEPEGLWPRNPPVRVRKSIPDCWLEITITEGKNRQVRRMTAAVGHPTLRLIRAAIGEYRLADLPPGEWREITL